MQHDIYTPPSGPPQASAPALFHRMGESALYQLSDRCYTLLGQSAISDMFPGGEALQAAARKQAEFFIGILGGPPLYLQKHGPPRMRARHFPFPIGEAARQEWLRCFRAALGDGAVYGLTPSENAALLDWVESFSAWMVNQEPNP